MKIFVIIALSFGLFNGLINAATSEKFEESPNKMSLDSEWKSNVFLYGITFDKNGEFKVSNEINNTMADNSLPAVQSIGKLEMVNTFSSTTESHENEKNFTIGAFIKASVNFGVRRESISADGTFSNTKNSKQKRESVHITSTILNIKERIALDTLKINASNWFVNNVFSIMNGLGGPGSTSTVGAELIKFLNKYGWYFPVDYVVGGAISKSTVCNNITDEKASEVAKSIGYEIKAKIASIGKVSTRVDYSNSSSKDLLTSFGAGGASNIEEFQQNMKNNKNWIVLKYNKLIPSLRLLHNNYAFQLDQIHRLLMNMYTTNDLEHLQPFINYSNYAMEIATVS